MVACVAIFALFPLNSYAQQPAGFNSSFGMYQVYNGASRSRFMTQMGFKHDDYWAWADQHAETLGCHWDLSHMQLIWDVIEPDIGEGYIWNGDRQTDGVITNIYSSPAEMNWVGGFHQGGSQWRNPLDYKEEYADFVSAVVERYDGDGTNDVAPGVAVKYWQAGNEIGIWNDLGRSLDDYLEYARLIRNAAKASDPNAKIMLMAPTTGDATTPWYVDVITELSVSNEFDAIDIHHWESADEWKMPAIPEYRQVLDSLGMHDAEIWSTGNGTWAGNPSNDVIQSEAEQAASLIKRAVWARANGLDKFFWQELIDENNDPPGRMFHFMGLVSDGVDGEAPDRENTVRACYWAYKLIVEKTDSGTATLDGEVQGVHDESTLYAYRYTRSDNGGEFFILWSESEPQEITLPVTGSLYHARSMVSDRYNIVPSHEDKLPSGGNIMITVGTNPVLVEVTVDSNSNGQSDLFEQLEEESIPTIVSVEATDSNTVEIVYSEPMDPETSTIVANYDFGNLVEIHSASLNLEGRTLLLHVSNLRNGEYTITIDGPEDESGIAIAAGTEKTFFYTDPNLLAQDSFESYSPGALSGLNGGEGWAGSWVGPGGDIEIVDVSNALVYTCVSGIEVLGGDKAVKCTGSSSSFTARELTAARDYSLTYISFLLRSDGTIENNLNQLLVHGTDVPAGVEGVRAGLSSAPGHSINDADERYHLGIDNTALYDGPDLSVGTTYFMVVECIGNGSNAWTGARLYIDPTSPFYPESVFTNSLMGASSVSDMAILAIRKSNIGSSTQMYIDEIRVGNTWASVIPLSSVAPLADLGMTQSVDDSVPENGQLLTFTTVVTNYGPNVATHVKFTGLLPPLLVYSNHATSQGTYDPVLGVWEVGTMDVDAAASLTLDAIANLNCDDSATNWVRLASLDQKDTNATNDDDFVILTSLLSEWAQSIFTQEQLDDPEISDKDADPDNDGMTNFDEFLSGTHPLNDKSVLAFDGIRIVPGTGIVVSWLSATNRQYSVVRASRVGDSFTPVAQGLPATPPVNTYTDTVGTVGMYIYRVDLD